MCQIRSVERARKADTEYLEGEDGFGVDFAAAEEEEEGFLEELGEEEAT